jgi:replicative DNA helicase
LILTLETAVDRVAEYSIMEVHRVKSGLRAVDAKCGGPAPGELFTIVGRSFTGKSVVAQNIILANRELPSVFFSLEMPLVQSVLRLYAMWSGTPAFDLQVQVEAGGLPDDIYKLVDAFPLHVVNDKPGLGVDDMADFYEAYRQHFKVQPAFCVVDYLELLGKTKANGGGYEQIEAQLAGLRDWTRYENTRTFLIHQANKSEPMWAAPTQDSPRGGGYTESDFMVGLWRPHLDPELTQAEAKWLENKLGINVLKNRAFMQLMHEQLFEFLPSGRLVQSYE